MIPGALAGLLLCGLGAAAAAALPRLSVHGPEPGHTGGFGEPTCRVCHFDGPERPTDTVVTLAGLPASWAPGRAYPLTLVLRGPGLRRGGFQLAARFATGERAGRQAGGFAGSPGSVTVTEAAGISYVHHVLQSTHPASPGEARWDLVWTAPVEPAGPVVIHVAANAANDDNSELGDLIVTSADTVAPGSR